MTFPSICRHWAHRFPWLLAATTVREGPHGGLQDFGQGLSTSPWDAFLADPAFPAVVHAQQVHGAEILMHGLQSPGRHVLHGVDGHATCASGVLLAITVADCVPVFLVSDDPRSIALLHAGWRGVAAGILEKGVAQMCEALQMEPSRLYLHLGPAISGPRYEVGPEVHGALGLPVRSTPGFLDLRAHLVERARRLGIPDPQIDVSGLCTFEDPRFYSHRGGDAGRQVALLGIRGMSVDEKGAA